MSIYSISLSNDSILNDESFANLENIISNIKLPNKPRLTNDINYNIQQYEQYKTNEENIFIKNQKRFKKLKKEYFNIIVAGNGSSGKTSLIMKIIDKFKSSYNSNLEYTVSSDINGSKLLNEDEEGYTCLNNMTFYNKHNIKCKKYKKTKSFTRYSLQMINNCFTINLFDSPHISRKNRDNGLSTQDNLYQLYKEFIYNSFDDYKSTKDKYFKSCGSTLDNNYICEINKCNYEIDNVVTNKFCSNKSKCLGSNGNLKNCKNKNKESICNKLNNNQNNVNNNIEEVVDERIHLILYCFSKVTEKDLLAMKELSKVTNIIPVLSKTGTYSSEEIIQLKIELIQKAKEYNIDFLDIYSCISVSHICFYLTII